MNTFKDCKKWKKKIHRLWREVGNISGKRARDREDTDRKDTDSKDADRKDADRKDADKKDASEK